MPKAKTEETNEEKHSKIEELKERAAKLSKASENPEKKKEKSLIEELREETEDKTEEKEEKNIEKTEEKHKKKKREIKKLSESELRRVMTDTKETIVPLTDYIACSVHLGTKVITPEMRKYVYKRRADGLAVINTNLLDDKLREAVARLNEVDSEDVFIVCKREAGWPAVEKFSRVTGIKAFTKKYPAGIITNLQLENFFEAKLAIICDPWVDKNALNDSLKLQLPIIGICDTNNYARYIDKVIPANNKSRKSIGLILYVLAKEYLKSQGKKEESKSLVIEDFTGKLESQESSHGEISEKEKRAEMGV